MPGSRESEETGGGARPQSEINRLVGGYIDRLNDGLAIDPDAIRRDHPDLAGELLEILATFIDADHREGGGGDLAGRSLGEYRFVRELGRGGMGVVYEAVQARLGRRVALKVLSAGILADSRSVARFLREAQVAARLHHPNIVSVYDLGVADGTPFFAMEYVEGDALSRILARARDVGEGPELAGEAARLFGGESPDLERCLGIAGAFAGVADGLQHAHEEGVIHRDVKPSNLVLDRDGALRILDFGLAHLEGQQSLTGSRDVVGTPLYMSPEQATARGVAIDHRTDIYSLGATVYECLCGRPPFRGRTHQETVTQIISREVLSPRRVNPSVPRDLETIVLKCLAKRPSDRYATAEALAQDLRRLVRGQPIEARPLSLPERLARRTWAARWRVAAGLLVVLLVATSSLLVVTGLRERRRRALAEYTERVLEHASDLRLVDIAVNLELGRDEFFRSWSRWPAAIDRETEVGERGRRTLEEVVEGLAACTELLPSRPDASYHRARALLLLDKDDEALEAVERALELAPGFAAARVLRARILEERGDREAGTRERRRARELAPAGWNGAWLEAHEAASRRQWKEAADAYGRLVELYRDGEAPYLGFAMDAYLGRGHALLKAGEFERAIECLSTARHRWERALEPAVFLAWAWHREGRRARTDAILEEIRESHGSDRAARWASTLYALLGDWYAARVASRDVDDPVDRATRKLMSSVNQERWTRTAEEAHEVLALDPNHFLARKYLGWALAQRGRFEEAAVACEEFRLRYPESPDVLLVRAGIEACRDNHAGAVALLEEILEGHPSHTAARNNLGVQYTKLGNNEAAENAYRANVRRHPKYYASHRNLGRLSWFLGDFERSLRWMRRAIELEPTPDAHAHVGRSLWGLGRREEAVDELTRASARWPQNIQLHFELGRCLLEFGRAGEAVEALRTSVKLGASAAWPLHVLGAALEELGDLEGALGQYRRALETGTGWRGTYGALARLLRKPGAGDLAPEIDALIAYLEERVTEPDAPRKAIILQGLALLWREHPTRADAAKVSEYERRVLDAIAGENSETLWRLAELQFEDGQHAKAVRTLERATTLPGTARRFRRRLERYRRAALPGLPSVESVDAALAARDRRVLIPRDAVWKLRRGAADPFPPTGWTGVEFDDGDWEEARAGIGYGLEALASVLDDMKGAYTQVCIRRAFEVDEPKGVRRLRLSAHVDDGLVAYVNGVPVRARNAPVGIPGGADAGPDAVAAGIVSGTAQLLDPRPATFDPEALPGGANVVADIDPALLRRGRNVLAVRGFNHGPESSDFALVPVLEAEFAPDAARDRELLARFREVAPAKDPAARLAYFEARILQRSGEHERAADAFLALGEELLGTRVPCLRLVESLRATGRSDAALARVEKLLDGPYPGDAELLDLRVAICLGDLRWSAGEVLERAHALPDDWRRALEALRERGAVRINCGGEDYTDAAGRPWGADRLFRGGELPFFGVRRFEEDVLETEDDLLYQTARWFPPGDGYPVAYRVPLPAGRYRVTLHHAENYFKKPSRRLFEALLEGERQGGGDGFSGSFKTARTLTAEVDVADGFLELGFIHVLANPEIAAIEIERRESR